jgi:hypothetical protein
MRQDGMRKPKYRNLLPMRHSFAVNATIEARPQFLPEFQGFCRKNLIPSELSLSYFGPNRQTWSQRSRFIRLRRAKELLRVC